ncbi:MAG: large-conductance mechanosensitive channel protein MscL [Clostridia bacterium]|nr:large-conductance mechanosensitive channel protein MscL [Clostridia bacterium]
MRNFVNEFKKFISKGNVVDMAIAVIMGGAFGKIVTSLVNDIIMPLISVVIGGLNVKDWKWVIKAAEKNAAGDIITEETALTYGVFLQNVIDFLIIAFCIFVMLRLLLSMQNRFRKPAKEEPVVEAPKETELDVLMDIRSMLKEQNKGE